jgi:sugar lactone lactonase YvrE
MRLVRCLLATSALSLILTGCSVRSVATNAPGNTSGTTSTTSVASALKGHVHGGQNPISGAHVYLFEVTPGGYGNPSTSLLQNLGPTQTDGNGNEFVITQANGSFSVTSTQYHCDSGDQVYLYAVGGNAGFGTNPHAGLMAVIGQCGAGNSFSPAPTGTIQMNEVTTVAAAYALAGYAEDATDMSGNENGNAMSNAGLANAAANAAVLASIETGSALAPGVNGTAVQNEVNTLADMLAACINSNGTESATPAPGTACYQLLTTGTQAYGNAGATANDTATEAIYIAHNPSYNTALYSLATASSPFQNVLTTQPNDWTIAITYADATFNGATDLAIDATGNVWVTNNDPCSSQVVSTVTINTYCITEVSPKGQDLSGPTGYLAGSLNQPYGIAIDTNTPGNIWIANNDGDANTAAAGTAITELTPATSTTVTSNGFANATLVEPWGIAVDGYTGGVWVADFGNNYLSEFQPGSGFVFTSPQGSGGLNDPTGVAIDGNDNVWVANSGGFSGDTISEFYGATGLLGSHVNVGDPYPGTPFTVGAMPEKVAIDPNGVAWTPNYGGSAVGVANASVSQYNNTNTPVVEQNFTEGGITGTYGGPYGIAVDGAGNIWIANYGPGEVSYTGSITELNNNGSPSSPANGFQPGLNKPDSIAIDASGNVWVVNNGDGTLTELIGAASPVPVPLSNTTLAGQP